MPMLSYTLNHLNAPRSHVHVYEVDNMSNSIVDTKLCFYNGLLFKPINSTQHCANIQRFIARSFIYECTFIGHCTTRLSILLLRIQPLYYCTFGDSIIARSVILYCTFSDSITFISDQFCSVSHRNVRHKTQPLIVKSTYLHAYGYK